MFNHLSRSRLAMPMIPLLAVVIGGCSSSPWDTSYVGVRDPLAAQAAGSGVSTPIVVRSVPWERVQQTLSELQNEAAASDVHPDEWASDQKLASKQKLLKGLQITETAESIQILGRSEFRTTDSVRPESQRGEAELAAFGRTLGADMIVWSGRYLGKAERIVKESVSTYSSGTDWGWRRHGEPSTFSDYSTTWVPIKIELDELGYIAFFLKKKE